MRKAASLAATLFGCAVVLVNACRFEIHLGVRDETAFGGAPSSGRVGGGCGELLSSDPIIVTEAGALVENLHIESSGQPAIIVRAPDVIVRNVAIEHEGAPGVLIETSSDVLLENVSIEHVGAPESGPHTGEFEDNITCVDSPRLVVRRARLVRGASGAFLDHCEDADLRFIEGHDVRGPSFRGQLVRFDHSHRGRLTDFSIINPNSSWSENNVHAAESSEVYIARGLIDGNNGPQGHGVLFSGEDAWGTVEDVDAIHMGNGCFSAYTGADGSVFRRTRCRDNICGDQGRGEPTSGAIMWSGDEAQTNLVVEDSAYFGACNPAVIWPEAAFSTSDLREEDFTPRAPQQINFCWE